MRFALRLTVMVLLVALLATVMPPSGTALSNDDDFFSGLPRRIQPFILWSADNEEGSLADWQDEGFIYPGGGVFPTGPPSQAFAEASTVHSHSGEYSIRTQIRGAIRALQGNRAVRLMRWTEAAWDDGGSELPRSAFYSTWLYMPAAYNPNKYEPWDPGDGGWWNIFQFKANIEESSDTSVPMFAVNVTHDDDTGENFLYLYSEFNAPHSFEQRRPVPLPIGEWVHLEAYFIADTAENGGRIAIYQNGELILRALNVDTIRDPAYPHPTWGIGNYTDHVANSWSEGSAQIYFDDSAISRLRLSRWLDS